MNMALFTKLTDADYLCDTWFERDRAQVRLYTKNGREVFCLNDDDVYEAIQDGFLTRPKVPRPSDADWLPHALAYARYYGLIPRT